MKYTNGQLILMGIGIMLPVGCQSQNITDKNTHPNVVYIFPDQMRNHAMQFWNDSVYSKYINFKADPVHTPNLNKFAGESLVLTSAISNCPLSSPHRGMLLTGMYTENSGIALNCNSNRPNCYVREETTTISDVFSAVGYDCAYIGKLHADFPLPNDPENPGHYVESQTPVWDAYTPPERRHGFNFWYSYGTFDVHKHPHYWDTDGKRHDINEWSPTHEANVAIEYIKNTSGQRNPDKPFFMVVSMNPPHSPYGSLDDCMEEDYNLYKDISLNNLLVRPNVDHTMEKTRCAPYYFASVTGVDREFGRIISALKEKGLDENTIIVFTSDHGETMCSQGLQDPKNSPYNEAVNVPFMIRYPKKIKHRVDDLLLSSPDIMPTLLSLSGLESEIPDEVEGNNLAGHFVGDSTAAKPKGALYIRNGNGDVNKDGQIINYFPVARGIITNRYTLVYTIDKDNKLKETLLFDNFKDPYQMNNLRIENHSELVSDLNKEMVLLLKQADDPWYTNKILDEKLPY